jgi:outer membrane receptor protein involved in Fe transport
MEVRHLLLASAFVVALAPFALAASAYAQAEDQVETVVVTAQKRTQDVQAVPVTVDAFNGAQLRQSNISTVNDLQKIAPSLFVYTTTSGASDTTMKIRGVGTTGNNPGLEAAVGTFIDGVYRNRSGLALGDLVDVDRIEVLEGPQSTLFGKNTSAGALSIVTKQPDQSYDGFFDAGISNYDGYKFNGGINIPVTDRLATRWVGVYDKRDGFITDENNGQKINDRNRYLLKGQALWTPNDDVSVRVIADYASGTEHCCAAIRVINGPSAGIINVLEAENGFALTQPSTDRYVESLFNPDNPVAFTDTGGSAELNWQLNDSVKLTNITAYRTFSQTAAGDFDFTGAEILPIPHNAFKDNLFSEELRFSAHSNFSSIIQSMDWLAGGYYTNELIHVHQMQQVGSQAGNYFCALIWATVTLSNPPAGCLSGNPGASTLPALGPLNFNLLTPGTGDDQYYATHEQSWSGFAQSTFNITDKLAFTGGLRGSQDAKSGSFTDFNFNPAQYDLPFFVGNVYQWNSASPISALNLGGQHISSSALTGTANLQYFWADQLMTYVDYSRGTKDGGFNLDRTAAGIAAGLGGGAGRLAYNPFAENPAYKPEYSDNFEGGLKSKWFDNHLLVNGTIFYEKFRDLQVLNFDGIDFHIVNMPTGTSKGFELQTEAALFEGFTVNGGVTYADTRYGAGAQLPILFLTGYSAPISLKGDPFTNAPLWSTTEGATYSFPLGDSGLTAALHGDLFYGSKRNTGSDENPLKVQGGYTLFNGRATLIGQDDHWELAAWCSNCTNKKYSTVVFDSVVQTGIPVPGQKYLQGGSMDSFVGDPAFYGLTASFKF